MRKKQIVFWLFILIQSFQLKSVSLISKNNEKIKLNLEILPHIRMLKDSAEDDLAIIETKTAQKSALEEKLEKENNILAKKKLRSEIKDLEKEIIEIKNKISLPLPNVATSTLQKIIKLVKESIAITKKVKNVSKSKEEIEDLVIETLGKKLAKTKPKELSELISTAHYLNTPIVTQALCWTYAGLLVKDKETKQEAKDIFLKLPEDVKCEIEIQYLFRNNRVIYPFKKYFENSCKAEFLLKNQKLKNLILKNAYKQTLHDVFKYPHQQKPYTDFVTNVVDELCNKIHKKIKNLNKNDFKKYYEKIKNHKNKQFEKAICIFSYYDHYKENIDPKYSILVNFYKIIKENNQEIIAIRPGITQSTDNLVNAYLYYFAWLYKTQLKTFKNLPIKINLSRLNMKKIPEAFQYMPIYPKKLIELILQENKITKLEKKEFQELKKLKFLNLENNMLKSLADETFKNQKDLQILNLTDNNIKYLNQKLFESLTNLKNLYLDINPLDKKTKKMIESLKKKRPYLNIVL